MRGALRLRIVKQCCWILALLVPCLPARAEKVFSPDGTVEFDVWLQDEGTPVYAVRRFGDDLVRPSRLGFLLAEGKPLSTNFKMVGIKHDSHDETWEQPWGEKRTIRCQYNEMRLVFEQQDEQLRQWVLVVRAFDDGVGFRYEFPQQPHLDQFAIADELTEFAIAHDSSAWWIPAFQELRYEYLYQQSPVQQLRKVHTPLTIKTKQGVYLSIHEAALTDYASMTLANTGNETLKAELTPWSDGVKVIGSTPMVTPWRTVQIADTPGELIESYLILNLNEPSKIVDTSWIKPGKYVGVWWDMHLDTATWSSGERHGATTERTKKYIDFAAEHGLNGVLVEGWNIGWDGDWMANADKFSFTQPYPDYDLPGLAQYAAERNVYLVAHNETSGGIANYERQLEDAFSLYERLGIKAVKTGYVAAGQNVQRHDAQGQLHREWHHGQFMVRHYRHVVEEAAKHHLMTIAHEPIKPTGIRRTWPNMIAREGARGQEYNAWDWQGGNPPDHTVILPFTRMLAGPMDFTPGVFDLLLDSGNRPNNRVNTTLAKQLALYVVIYSPMQMAVDFPENYEQHRDAFQFIEDVATDWEETRVLNGEIGDYVTIARQQRGSDQWFLGSITDETGRTLQVPLSFLTPGTTYRADIYRDADNSDWQDNPSAYTIEHVEVDSSTVLPLRLAPGGGQAIRFTPQHAEVASAE